MTGNRFLGTVTVDNSPLDAEDYHITFYPSADGKDYGFSNYRHEIRANQGFYKASFNVSGTYSFMSEFLRDGLGRSIKSFTHDGRVAWEGYIEEMSIDVGRAISRISLREMANAVWVRYRIRGATTTQRSAVQTDADSIARYGRKEFVISGGELESSDVADQTASAYLENHKMPSPTPVKIDPFGELNERPVVSVTAKGWFDTLNWCTYNQTASTDSQGAASQIEAIITDTDVGQFVSSYELGVNATSVSKEYDADRRGGDIVRDIARLGDSSGNRYVVHMDEGRKFVYEQAAPPTEPA